MDSVQTPVSIASTGPAYTSPASSTTSLTPPNTSNLVKPGEPGFRNPHDKKGRSTSCLLCQKRKQKCDHRLPSCTTCIKAGVKCIQPAKYAIKAPTKDEYTIMLEKKVKFLEKILDVNNISIDEHGNPNVKKNFKYKKLSPFINHDESSLPINQNNFHKLNSRKLPMIPDAKVNSSSVSLESIDYSNSIFAKYKLNDFTQFDPVFEVDEKYSRAFLDIYFTRLQFKYPLLDEEEVFEFHNAYVTNNNLTNYMKNIGYFHFCCARMWLIYAISSCLQMSTGKYLGPQPERYFSTAIRHVTKCGLISDLQKCELLTLTVLYLIRTDRDSVCLYEIIKDSLELCTRLGLNRSQTYWTLLPKDRTKKIRIWWCNYLLERMICIAVGKSHSLDEKLVDPDLPLFEFEHSKSIKHPNNINFINQSIKLRRIESRFVEELNIISSDQPNNIVGPLPIVEKFFQELEIWRGNCEVFSNGIENETLRLYYYRSVRLLIQPFLELMDPMDKLFRECQAAAGHICQSFKVFHQKTVFGHSTTAIHTVFSAGVTLIYCLWLARNKDDLKRKELGDSSKHTRPTVSKSLFNGLNDLRACSICLYVMTERSKFALVFRETFDQLMTATITNLIERCGPDASEIIYSKEPGMPPAIVRKLTDYNYYKSTGFVTENNSNEDKIEKAERRRKQGQLQKNVVPKSLSHLLIPSSDEDLDDLDELPNKKQKLENEDEVNLNSFQYPMNTSQQEISLFNGRTNKMINNISVWTGESGGVPITTSLFDQNNYTTAPKNQTNQPQNNKNNNYLWNVPVEEFWRNNDDYGFLA